MRRTYIWAVACVFWLACGTQERPDTDLSTGLTGLDDSTGGNGSGGSGGPGSGGDGDGDGDPDGGILFDVMDGEGGTAGDGGEGECGCGSELAFSYIWVANTGQNTVSKINTQTLEEEGRYLTHPGNGNPSRTSVSLSGRMAAVANRNGGVVAIHTLPEDCDEDANGQPGLQTSTGKNDVLPWGQDDCIAWFTPFSYQSQRPIAWIAGELNEATCTYSDEMLWTSGKGFNASSVKAHLLNGKDGSTVMDKTVTGFDPNNYGGYGGAVDSEGNFWLTNWDRADIAVVYRDGSGAAAYPHSDVGGYGITVDQDDRVWTTGSYQGGVARFDTETKQWAIAGAGLTSATGLAQSADGRMWTGGRKGDYNGPSVLVWLDPDSMQVGGELELDGFPKGISVDHEGFVWVVTMERAHKVDPDSMQLVDSYDGLDGPYTYSDMTGWGLQNTACPNPEG